MSRSGHPGDGGLTPSSGWLADIKQTLKLLFKQIEVKQAPLGVTPPMAVAWATPVPDVYGGQTLLKEANWFSVSLTTPSASHQCELVTHADLSTNQAMTEAVLAPLAEENLVGDGLMQLMTDALHQVETTLPDVVAASHHVERYAARVKGGFKPLSQIHLKRIPMHFVRKALKWGLRHPKAKPLPPIVRKSLPLTSLTERQKYALLKIMAEKAQCKIHEVKLVAVYDRLFVSAYQSMRPTGSGELLCYPKMPQQPDLEPTPSTTGLRTGAIKSGFTSMASRTVDATSEVYWLLVGQRNAQPPVPLMTMVTHQQIQTAWATKKGGAS